MILLWLLKSYMGTTVLSPLFFSDGCSISACIVEASFVRNAQFWSFGNSLEPEFRHADAGKGTFVVVLVNWHYFAS